MTLKELIDMLEDMTSEEAQGGQIEVLTIHPETGEPYTPVISIGPDNDGVRRLWIT